MYDWKSPPSSLYNLCIEGAFCADFWASTKSGLNDLDKISPGYQERWRFIGTLRTYLTHIKRMLHLASQRCTHQVAFKNRSAKNSCKSTVSIDLLSSLVPFGAHCLERSLTYIT